MEFSGTDAGEEGWGTGTGTPYSRTDIPPRARGGGARRAGTLWTRSLAYARPQIRRQSLKAASALRAGSQERSGAVLTASSQATEFTMVSGGKRCSCGMSQCGMPQCVTRRSCSSARAVVRREQALELLA